MFTQIWAVEIRVNRNWIDLELPARMAASTSVSVESPTRRNGTWLAFQLPLRILFAVWLRYRARGTEQIPAVGGGLVLANHQSFLDPLMIGLPLSRPVSFLARDSLFKVPLIGLILKNTYVKPINRENASTASIRETVQRAEQGFLCGLFPEGTRSTSNEMGEFKPGFIALARRLDLPIYPVGIAGTHLALGRGSCLLKPYRVRVVFGPPILPAEIAELKARGREQELVDYVRQRVLACQQEAEAWRLGGKATANSLKVTPG